MSYEVIARGPVVQEELFRDNCQGGIGLGGISWEQLSRVGLFKGNCFGGGGKSPEGIILGGISWGGELSGG